MWITRELAKRSGPFILGSLFYWVGREQPSLDAGGTVARHSLYCQRVSDWRAVFDTAVWLLGPPIPLLRSKSVVTIKNSYLVSLLGSPFDVDNDRLPL